jgi:SAM-dependent methyltransferase
MAEPSPAQFWESRYADAGQVWSGRPNDALVALAADLPAGRALDLGCGEGGDSIWLAGHGWQVTGVDISRTAITRASAAADAAGIPHGRIRWLVGDLASWTDDGRYELVSACFLQSPVELARTDILRRAAGLVVTGGHLLIVSHAAFPPWAAHLDGHRLDGPEHRFLSPAEQVDDLQLPSTDWEVLVAGLRPRKATGPNGAQAVLDDVVVLFRRTTNSVPLAWRM